MQRALVRAARRAPLASLENIATGAETAPQAVAALNGRGRCAAAIAAAAPGLASDGGLGRRLLSEPACPPPVVRAAGERLSAHLRDAAAGSSAWATRTLGHPGAERDISATGFRSPARWGLSARPYGAATRCRAARCAADVDGWLRGAAAESAAAAPALLDRLADSPDSWVRESAISNPACPARALRRIAAGPSMPRALRDVASSPACAASLLRDLAQHPVPAVALRALSNPNCPGDTVDRLAAHPDPAMREAALAHPSCPLKTIRRAGDDSMLPAARGAARNPNCPKRLLNRLVRGSDGARLVAAHPQCPASTLAQLAAQPAVPRRAA